MHIPFHRPCIGEEEIAETVATLRSGWLTTGAKAKCFESEFATYVGQRHAVAVNSCTAALHLALEALGVREGDTVVVPTMTFAATAEVVRYFNAKPLLVDVRTSDFNLDVADAARRIDEALGRGERVRAIIPVHYAGQVGDVAGVAELARRFDLRVVDDAAHCCPALYRHDEQDAWKSVGAEADVTCFSFYANKTITTGEGGMACTNAAAIAERMRIMSLHGISRDAWKRFTSTGSWYYEILAPGFKYNLTDLAAGIGLHQLRKADVLRQKRAEVAAQYAEQLKDVDEVILPSEQPHRVHSWHLYVVRLRRERVSLGRAEVIDRLRSAGIGTSVHWMPLHMHPYYRDTFGYQAGDLPCAARLFDEIISLPIYPDLSAQEVASVSETLRTIVARERRIGKSARISTRRAKSQPEPVEPA